MPTTATSDWARPLRWAGGILLAGAILPVLAAPASIPPDAFGNVIPDFSMAGYRQGGVALPTANVVERLEPAVGSRDDSARIQAAIDRVAQKPARPSDGVRGAVLLARGTYRCGSTLKLPPGVTLRGEGQDPNGTRILATMTGSEGKKPTLIRMEGEGGVSGTGPSQAILDEALPLGSKTLRVANASAFRPGDLVLVERKATANWISDLQMDRIKLNPGGHQWTPEGFQVKWSARVTRVQGDRVTLDIPVLCAIEKKYGGGTLRKATDTRRSASAVEQLWLESAYERGKEKSDERHAWNAITVNHVVDAWVRNVTAAHFAYSCVNIGKDAERVTVQDCAMLDPVSEVTGGRRYSFVAGGPCVLVQRCYAREGRHDFVTGHLDIGPTVFLDCLAEKAHADAGPHHRWSCGQLYDNVKARSLNAQDRGGSGTGHGWAGNCQVFWNCEAANMICQKPWIPSAQNWAIGCIADKSVKDRPSGYWDSHGQHVQPRSLYLAQLAERITREGGDAAAALRAVTLPEQRTGSIWTLLKRQYDKDVPRGSP